MVGGLRHSEGLQQLGRAKRLVQAARCFADDRSERQVPHVRVSGTGTGLKPWRPLLRECSGEKQMLVGRWFSRTVNPAKGKGFRRPLLWFRRWRTRTAAKPRGHASPRYSDTGASRSRPPAVDQQHRRRRSGDLRHGKPIACRCSLDIAVPRATLAVPAAAVAMIASPDTTAIATPGAHAPPPSLRVSSAQLGPFAR